MVELNSKRGEIGLSDLVRAIKNLPRLVDVDLQQVARSLGYALAATSVGDRAGIGTQAKRGAWNRPRFRDPPPETIKQPVYSPKPGMPPARDIPPELPETILMSALEIMDPVASGPSIIPANVDNHEPLKNQFAEPIARQSLFSKSTIRGLLVPAVAQPAPGIDLDIPRLVDCFVRCQFPGSLPTRRRYTTRNGCHLLLDFSDQLMPWWPDMQDLMNQLHSVIGPETSPVYEFEGDPANAVYWSGDEGKSWKPVSGVPVLVASDLGTVSSGITGYRPGPEAWRQFARKCASRQVPVIVLVPVEPHRWPKGLDRLIKLIHWNPATDAASVQRLLGEFQ